MNVFTIVSGRSLSVMIENIPEMFSIYFISTTIYMFEKSTILQNHIF